MKIQRALSIKQPHNEAILRGIKTNEYRSRRTNIRERVYLYSPLTLCKSAIIFYSTTNAFLWLGHITGSVEIVDCQPFGNEWKWLLEKPERLRVPIKPTNHPQPVFWFPEF